MWSIPVFLALFSLSLADEVCYQPCGCFSDDPPFDDRPLPESPEEQEITWLLYTQSNPNIGQEIHWDDIPDVYDPSKPTKFLIHGYTGSPSSGDVSMNDIKDAFLEGGYDYNVILVDWSTGAATPNYALASSNTRVVGSCSGYLASVITTLSTVHCIGHSLGGHTCGSMGKFLNGDLGRISGLDPAGPAFEGTGPEVRLDITDADLVDVLHTNSLGDVGTSGIEEAIGDVDFYPHNGGRQPPCNTNGCDHGACKLYYEPSIREPSCTFLAYPCNSYEDGDAGLCNSCTEGVDCQSMGFLADTYPGRGVFYLEVDDTYPYCQN